MLEKVEKYSEICVMNHDESDGSIMIIYESMMNLYDILFIMIYI